MAVITNGSLLHLPEVREELRVADAVLPSLDAGTEDLYLRLNRPQPVRRGGKRFWCYAGARFPKPRPP